MGFIGEIGIRIACGCNGDIKCDHCPLKDGRIDSRIRKENDGTRYIIKNGEKFTVHNAIFNRSQQDVEFVASIMCEDRFYDEDFIVAYFARDYPIPNVNRDRISNTELLAYLDSFCQ